MRNLKKNKPKYPLLYSGAFCLTTGMDMATIPRICTDLHSAPMIIAIKIRRFGQPELKVITRKQNLPTTDGQSTHNRRTTDQHVQRKAWRIPSPKNFTR